MDFDNDVHQCSERGLLDLSIALSTKDITAGKQFTIFVLIKNPFDKQTWIREVDVSLPSELKIAESHHSILSRLVSIFELDSFSSFLGKKHLRNQPDTRQMKSAGSDDISEANNEAIDVQSAHQNKSRNSSNILIQGGRLGDLTLGSAVNLQLVKGKIGDIKVLTDEANL